jgi:hypothetical protein
VFHGWSDVPASLAVRGPSAALSGGLMEDDADAGGCHGGTVVVECPVELGISGEARI